MLIATLVIASSFVLSSAQPSSQCVAAYNATFDSADGANCAAAYLSLQSGSSTDVQEEMMVCNSSYPCNTMIENIINLCGDTISSPTRSYQNLLCTRGPNGICYSGLIDSSVTNALQNILQSCAQSCGESCGQFLAFLNDTVGCCAAEIVQALVDDGTFTSAQASLIANIYPESCDLQAYRLCNGSTLPVDACTTATVNLLGPNDICSTTVQGFFGDGNPSLINLFNGDCPTRFHAYATECSESFGDNSNEIIQFANAILTISQARTTSGGNCTELGSTYLSDDGDNQDEDQVDCSKDYFMNQCSAGCRQELFNTTMQYDCCLNTIFGEFSGGSDKVHDQIDFVVLTREMYNLCGVSSGGFCAGITPPSYTTAAEQCVNARNSFFADSTCLNYYLTLSKRLSATAVNSAATAICANQRCKDRMSSYIDYLTTCQVEYFLNDNNNEAVANAKHLEFAYFTGNTTCRVDSSNTSCYSSIYFNQQYNIVSAAFETRGQDGACVSAVSGPTCSEQCSWILNMTEYSVGCCFGEYGRVLLGTDVFMTVLNRCNATSFGDRCTEMEAIQDDNTDHDAQGGVGVQRGFSIIVILLLGVMASTLS